MEETYHSVFSSIEEHHKSLYQWFLFHQESLLCQQDDMAAKAWQVFCEGLRLHIELENTYLFSSQSVLVQEGSLNWPLKVYLKEHDKILDLMRKIDSLSDVYFESTGRKKRLLCLELIEKQVTFRHVLEHHEEREELDVLQNIQDQSESQQHQAQKLLDTLNDWTVANEQSRQEIKQTLAQL